MKLAESILVISSIIYAYLRLSSKLKYSFHVNYFNTYLEELDQIWIVS